MKLTTHVRKLIFFIVQLGKYITTYG